MARFELAIDKVLSHEGGYVNDSADRGGETKFGISKRSYPDVDIRNLTLTKAKEIYQRDWWDSYGYEAIVSQVVATKVFDLAINMGAKQAHKLLQRALHANGADVVVDGVIGPRTLRQVNLLASGELLPAYRSEAAGFYRAIVAKNPSQRKFINGWLKRAYA